MARVCFIGTILDVAAAVVIGGHELVGVVGHGGRPGLRRLRHALRPGPAERLARGASASFINVSGRALADLVDDVRACRPEVLLCAGWPGRVPDALLAVPRLGGINVHPSTLPAHRGPDPLAWTILAGDTHTSLTFHHMTSAFDAGDLVAQHPVPVLVDDTRGSLGNRCFAVAVARVGEVLRAVESGAAPRAPQPPGVVAERRPGPRDLALDFTLPTALLSRRLRARLPQPVPILVDGHAASVTRVVTVAAMPRAAPGHVEAVIHREHGGCDIAVATVDGLLWLTLAEALRGRLVDAAVRSPGR